MDGVKIIQAVALLRKHSVKIAILADVLTLAMMFYVARMKATTRYSTAGKTTLLTGSDSVGYCFGCQEEVPDNNIINHVRLFHVDAMPEFWPDGEPVISEDPDDYGD